jgi:rod shape-determining protein MreD
MRSKFVLLLTTVVCFLIQSTVLHLISIGSITPNLLLILCVSMGLMRGRKVGLWTGFFSGFLIDLFYGSVFGFYALIYMYVGFFSGYTFRIYYDDDIKVPIVLTVIMDTAVSAPWKTGAGYIFYKNHCSGDFLHSVPYCDRVSDLSLY